MLNSVSDYTHLTKGSWTTDDYLNALIGELIHNYKIKVSDLQGSLRRSKFTVYNWRRIASRNFKACKNLRRQETKIESR